MRAVLALDQGGHASRACLFDAAGTLIAQAQVPIDTQRHAGCVEHDAVQLADTLAAAAVQALEQQPHIEPECVALATQRSTVVCFERSSVRALSPAISWQDRRAADWLAGFAGEQAHIGAVTGLPLSPHYGVGKLHWCLQHLPAVRAARTRADLVAGPLAAWLIARLTGASARVDPANASRTLLYDARARQWSASLAGLFGIDTAVLPACVPTCGDFGQLRVAGRALALKAVTGDQSAIPFACGPPDEHTLYINLGTGAFIQQPRRRWPAAAGGLLRSVLAAGADAAWYSLEGTVNGAGSATAQYALQAGVAETALWAQLEQLPENIALPLFVNGVGGLGSPYWQPRLASGFIGTGSALQCFAAVVESIAFLVAANWQCLGQLAGPVPRQVLLTGGLSRSHWLCQRLADLLGVPVARLQAEATARGAAALAAPALARNWVAVPERTFQPKVEPALMVRQAQFEQALQAAIRATH